MAFPEDLVEVLDKGLRVAEQAEKEQELPEVVQIKIPLLLVGDMMVELLQLMQMVELIILLVAVVVLVLLEQILLIKAPDKAGLVVMV
tara:strand:- start:117 stop:380 length:264 start_codon:yes stop_codon:yes gene_type:complete